MTILSYMQKDVLTPHLNRCQNIINNKIIERENINERENKENY